MEKKILSIETVTVDIKVVTVDNKRMTLSVFKQIREEPFFDRDFNRLGSLLGYINKDGYWIIWTRNGELRKTVIEKIPNENSDFLIGLLRMFSLINSKVSNSFDFKDYGIPISSQKVYTKISKEEVSLQLSKAQPFVDMYNEFCENLLDGNNQLFISI